jgi:hypothetical protein
MNISTISFLESKENNHKVRGGDTYRFRDVKIIAAKIQQERGLLERKVGTNRAIEIINDYFGYNVINKGDYYNFGLLKKEVVANNSDLSALVHLYAEIAYDEDNRLDNERKIMTSIEALFDREKDFFGAILDAYNQDLSFDINAEIDEVYKDTVKEIYETIDFTLFNNYQVNDIIMAISDISGFEQISYEVHSDEVVIIQLKGENDWKRTNMGEIRTAIYSVKSTVLAVLHFD